ncbi:MAG TPA: DivIVA domain-containing protein, partial [Acidimicrobiales bacterium]|nr:DivIVA domain-containing protein [Acidimicrobiales bacterium]
MPLSPEEIQNRDFLVALRGYDKHEVETFLQDVADQYAELMEELALARQGGVSASPSAADPFADLGDHVASVMRAATEAANQRQSDTEREAASILAAAREDAEHAAAEARLELDAASELRAEAEREAAHLRATAREEVERIRNEARQVLTQAQHARETAEQEAAELREGALRHGQEVRDRAEQTVLQFIESAKREIEETVKQVLGGMERLQRAEQHSLSFGTTVPPENDEPVENRPAPA